MKYIPLESLQKRSILDMLASSEIFYAGFELKELKVCKIAAWLYKLAHFEHYKLEIGSENHTAYMHVSYTFLML